MRLTLRLPRNAAISGGRFWFARLPEAMASEPVPPLKNSGLASDGLQGECFAGQNAGLRLDEIVEVHHVVVRICAREGKNIGILTVDLYFCIRNVDRLHAKRRDAYDRNHRKHERKNQPLVFAQDKQVVVKVWLAGRKV